MPQNKTPPRKYKRKTTLENTCRQSRANVVKFPQMRCHSDVIYFCSFSYHQGIIKDPEVCQERQCTHYREIPVRDLINSKDYQIF